MSKRTHTIQYFTTLSIGDLCESRTRIDGMKTRCTDRYTTRPFWYNIIIPNILEIARVMVVDVVVLAAVRGFWVDGDVSIGFVTITGDGGAIATVAAVIEEEELVQINFAKADFGIMSEGLLEGFAGVFAGFLELWVVIILVVIAGDFLDFAGSSSFWGVHNGDDNRDDD